MSQMEDLHRKIEKGGTQKARERHIAKGKMLVREYEGDFHKSENLNGV